MGEKIQQIHYARIARDTYGAMIEQRRRDDATANIQLRIMRKLVNFVSEFHADDLDQVLNSIDCLPSDWQELVETLNTE